MDTTTALNKHLFFTDTHVYLLSLRHEDKDAIGYARIALPHDEEPLSSIDGVEFTVWDCTISSGVSHHLDYP